MNRRGEACLVAAGMTALSVVLTWPLALHARTALPGDLADPLLNCFTLAWDADRMARGFDGLWTAPFFFPLRDTLAFSDHLLGIAVFTAPVQWLTGNAVLAYNLAFIASYALAGVGSYLLGRSLWGSRAAAWVAGVAFAAAPHRAMHISHLQVLMSGWLALSLWGLHHYAASGSRRALAVASGAYALLALSSSYLMFFGAIPLAIVAASTLAGWGEGSGEGAHERNSHGLPGSRDPDPAGAARRKGTPWRRAADFCGAGAAVLLALAPIAAAYLRVRQATGLRRTIGEMSLLSARVSDYLTIPPGLRAWSAHLAQGAPERMLFPGLVVFLLAAVALLVSVGAVTRRDGGNRRSHQVLVYAVILGLTAWLMAGPAVPGPYRWLVATVPGFDGLRVPARFIVVASLALAVLAARGAQMVSAGMSRWLHATGERGDRTRGDETSQRLVLQTAFSGLPAVLCVLIVVEGYAGPLPLAPFDARQGNRAALNGWLRAAPPGGVLELPVAGPAFAPFTTAYQFNTLLHGHPIVNGYTGTGSGLQDFLASPSSPLARAMEVSAATRGLRALGVRYVILHTRLYEQRTGWSAAALVEALDGDLGQVASRVQFGDSIAWRLSGAAPVGNATARGERRVSFRRFTATASAAPFDTRLAFDGGVDTRWTSGGPQQGKEWFQVTFDRPVAISRLVFRSDRNGDAERPNRLVIESIGDDGGIRTLFDDSLVAPIIASKAGLTDGTVLSLPSTATRALRLRQTVPGGRLPWSIFELEIDER